MRVEDIMSHSFKELHSRKKIKTYEKELLELNEEDDEAFAEIKNNPAYAELGAFYDACTAFIEMWEQYSVRATGIRCLILSVYSFGNLSYNAFGFRCPY